MGAAAFFDPGVWRIVLAEIGRAAGRAAAAAVAAAVRPLVDNPWWILVVPFAVQGLAGEIATDLNVADLAAGAAAWFAGRRWGAKAMLPVIFLCVPFIVAMPSLFMPGNFWTIPAILILYRSGGDPSWLARILAHARVGPLDLLVLLGLMLSGRFVLVAFGGSFTVPSNPAALLLPVLLVLYGLKRAPLWPMLGAILLAHAVFSLALLAFLPGDALLHFVDFRIGLSPVDLAVCVTALTLGRLLRLATAPAQAERAAALARLGRLLAFLAALLWCGAVLIQTMWGFVWEIADPVRGFADIGGLGGAPPVLRMAVDDPVLFVLAAAILAALNRRLVAHRSPRAQALWGAFWLFFVPGAVTALILLFEARPDYEAILPEGSALAGSLEQCLVRGVAAVAAACLWLRLFELAAPALHPAGEGGRPAAVRRFALALLGPIWLGIAAAASLALVAMPFGLAAASPKDRAWAFAQKVAGPVSATPSFSTFAPAPDFPGGVTPIGTGAGTMGGTGASTLPDPAPAEQRPLDRPAETLERSIRGARQPAPPDDSAANAQGL